ncbi:glycosyltransferase family 4 protein [Pontibacter burrus]|uniref:Glycosyltransferase family 4 protein n=1 Tax=Pontibacter burrus TaxID=2704466 RepID=A0A6B3LPQ7_9BACT|nr:glycosyltransferase family 4 protein [Pontibacter burrus]NEM98892.1 glycosyltransferase family 4 protein [Pontibacter burrus]
MKIGYFSHTSISPSETFIYDLYEGLGRKGLDVIYYCGKIADRSSSINSIVYTGYAEEGLSNSFLAYKFGQIAGGNGFKYKNKVQQHYAYKALNKSLTQRPDVAYVDYATSAVLLVDYFKEHNIPFIVHVHGYDVTSATNDPVYLLKLKQVFTEAKYIIAASHYIRKLLVLLGCNNEKIRVIRYGIDVKSISPLTWSERRKSDPGIIFLGRLTAKKNPFALLQAFRIVKNKVPNSRLTIVGDGELKQQVQERIKSLDLLSSVNMLGVLNREQSFPILNQHWVYAQHSVTANSGDQEGFAISLAEAAAHELPVVSTLHNGIPENVLDGKTGYLIKEFDYEGMGDSIIELIKNPDFAEKMGKAGRKHIAELCDPEKRIEQISQLLYSALQN